MFCSFLISCNNKPMYGYKQERIKLYESERVTRLSAEPGEIRQVLLYLERSKTCAFI